MRNEKMMGTIPGVTVEEYIRYWGKYWAVTAGILVWNTNKSSKKIGYTLRFLRRNKHIYREVIMKKTANKGNRYLTWVLRTLLILMILFWALFSLDVFEEEHGFWNIFAAFLMHNIPVILIIAWKREHIGGMLLMLCILGFTIFLIAGSGRFMYGTLIMVGIPFLIGAMFVVNHYLLSNKKAVNNTPPS